jgi:hypothetical protein
MQIGVDDAVDGGRAIKAGLREFRGGDLAGS